MRIKKEEGLTFEATSKRFKVGLATLFRWQKKLEPQLTRNKPATKVDMEALREDVAKNPDRYQWERAQDYGVSAWTIGVALRRLNLSRKKNAASPEG